ncbi:unnamed protein product [Trichobilharzia regenti]|nr:unnamed protein product [Trichobilharzia regenti]
MATTSLLGVPSTIIHLIQQLYDNAACQVSAIDNYTSHPTVIRQCCVPSNPPIDNYTPHPTVIRQCCMPSNPQAIDNYTSHPTVIRRCCMRSNPQRETYGSLRSGDGSEARLSTIANDFPDCSRLDNATDNDQ